MDESLCIREFTELAARLGIEIRYNNGGPSGLCTVKGTRVMFIDKNLDKHAMLELFVSEFKTLDLDGYFLVPVMRKLLEMEEGNSDK